MLFMLSTLLSEWICVHIHVLDGALQAKLKLKVIQILPRKVCFSS